ncbi:MAG: catalase [Nitrospirales bacterium]|nr:MAG: catalase [Nitrospirales bacterium]
MATQPLTTSSGMPVSDDENSLSFGPRGPLALQDHHLLEKLAHFNRERIPERVVHARGSGAYGMFTLTKSLKDFTLANFLQNKGEQTELFLRFSTVAGEQGSSDMIRDPRGFAVKFYTKEGNYDVVGNNTPVFFLRDPLKFPDFIHSQKRCPMRNVTNPDAVWDFWAHNPQSLHQITILFSDRGIPKSFRHMNGYGSHTFSFWNTKSERFWFKWHFKTNQGIQCLTNEEAGEIVKHRPWAAQEDLFDSIESSEYPSWTVYVQIMPEQEAQRNPWTFDLTKVWSHKDYPLIEVGKLELNKNPDNYFAEVEQSAMSPSNFVPGIGASPDKMLQARLFAYPDAHRYRLGANYNTLDVNRPQAGAINTYQRDGQMCPYQTGKKNYGTYDNSTFDGKDHPSSDVIYKEPPMRLSSEALDRFDHLEGNDDYIQAANLFKVMTENQKQQLGSNIAGALSGAREDIQERMLIHFDRVNEVYGKLVKNELGKQ